MLNMKCKMMCGGVGGGMLFFSSYMIEDMYVTMHIADDVIRKSEHPPT